MSEQSKFPDPRATLIEDLLTRQDDVIRQLEELDVKLLATIEEIRPTKTDSETEAEVSESAPATNRRAA